MKVTNAFAHLVKQAFRNQGWRGDFLRFVCLYMRTVSKSKPMMSNDFFVNRTAMLSDNFQPYWLYIKVRTANLTCLDSRSFAVHSPRPK